MNGNRQRLQRGLSLVELLVAMTIAMIILAGVTQTLLTNQKNQQWSDNVAYIQENARYAADLLSHDVRLAGYFGCAINNGATKYYNSVNPGGFSDFLDTRGLQGWDGTQTIPTDIATSADLWGSVSGNPKPDAFIVRRADDGLDLGVASHNWHAAQFKLTNYNPMSPGDLAIVVGSTCTNVSLVQMSGPSSGGTNVEFVHNTGTGSPGNCTKIIKDSNDPAYPNGFSCSSPGGAPSKCGGNCQYSPGATIMRYVVHAYYIGKSVDDSTVPALFRAQLQNNTSTGNVSAVRDELVPGVEDMQVRYGVDEDGDGNADRYATATSLASADWDKVVSARIELVMRSYDQLLPKKQRKYLGHTYDDKYLRQQVNVTVRLRNAGLGG